MNDDLQPYPEYKDSGLPWLGRVPAHWQVRRAKTLFGCVDVRSTNGKEELLTVSSSRGVVPRESATVTMFKAESYVGYKLCWPGDLVINSLWAWAGGLGVSRHHGIVSSAYGVYRLKSGFEDYSGFFHHLVRSVPFHWELRGRSKGIWTSRLQLTDDAFLRAPMPLPPLDETRAIVHFITQFDRKTNRFIRNRRWLIKVLNEQKQAIINRAATKGLDPNVEMKPCGIDWLGDIPEHWDVKPLKRWVLINESALPESTDPGYMFEYLDIGCVGKTGILVEKPSSIRFGDAPSRARRILRTGDTIISTVRTYLRAVYFVSENADNLVASTGFAVLTPRPGIVPEFLGTALQSNPFIDRVTAHSIGVAYPAIAETRLGAFPVAMPPSAEEQAGIVAHVRCTTKALTEGIKRAHREIDLIREYRTRLVADVVTGKVDVRHLAPPPGSEPKQEPAEELQPLEDVPAEFDEPGLAKEVGHGNE